jgi:hypothetical protein
VIVALTSLLPTKDVVLVIFAVVVVIYTGRVAICFEAVAAEGSTPTECFPGRPRRETRE